MQTNSANASAVRAREKIIPTSRRPLSCCTSIMVTLALTERPSVYLLNRSPEVMFHNPSNPQHGDELLDDVYGVHVLLPMVAMGGVVG